MNTFITMQKRISMKPIYLACLLGAFFSFNQAAIAADQVWTETMTCGDSTYKLESTCTKGQTENDLNTCKPQKLEISNHGASRSIGLPELNKADLKDYKKAGGKLKELFVTQWACGKANSLDVAVLHYSTGGGESETSEAIAAYDKGGKLIEEESSDKYDKARTNALDHLKPVRSIMPN